MDWFSIIALLIAIAIPIAGGFAGATYGGGADSEWYRRLNKPAWTPPSQLLPIIWTLLFILMGFSSWLIWQHGGFRHQPIPLAVYLVQLLLTFAWTPIFFGQHNLVFALVVVIILLLAVVATIVMFWPVSHIAAYLLIPYAVWILIAASINLYAYLYNQPGSDMHQPLSSA